MRMSECIHAAGNLGNSGIAGRADEHRMSAVPRHAPRHVASQSFIDVPEPEWGKLLSITALVIPMSMLPFAHALLFGKNVHGGDTGVDLEPLLHGIDIQ